MSEQVWKELCAGLGIGGTYGPRDQSMLAEDGPLAIAVIQRALNAARQAAIEECARISEDWVCHYFVPCPCRHDVADAIRAIA